MRRLLDHGYHSSQRLLQSVAIRLENSVALRAIYAAEAAITIGTSISAPIADVLLFITKNGVMLTC
jgi:hypothetical protein